MSDSDTVVVAGNPEGMPSARARSGSFCVHLWQRMRLEANGEARVCCAYQGKTVAQDGVPVSTDRQSLMQIWNADTMRDLRRDMVAGRRIAGCEECYTVEDRGGISIRLKANNAWERDWYSEQRVTIDQMIAQAVDHDFRLPKLPAMIEVEVGNICNLKCRMCNGFSSSRIANDPVQRKWEGLQRAGHDDPVVLTNRGKIRRVGPIDRLFDELAMDTGSRVQVLAFLGGEPFLVREIPRLLERLVAAGRARQIALLFISNGLIVPEWLSLAAHFRRVDLAISVDGYAGQYDYIRYPGRWPRLARNLQLFKAAPNVHSLVTTTVQVNNALSLTNLFRYLDSVEIGFTGYLLHNPSHLAVGALPSSIRRLAAARLRDYAEDDCRPQHRALVLSFAAEFEAGDDAGDPDRLRDFMLFTNDLDSSRGQSIHRTDPELVALLEQAGFPWLHETLHAPADPAEQTARHRRYPPLPAQNDALTLHRDLSLTIKSLRDELAQTRNELKRAQDELKQTDGDLKQAQNELRHTQDEQKQALDELRHTHVERQQARDEEKQARNELTQARDVLAMSEAQAARAGLQLAQVYASHSWRATRSLRAAGLMLRGLLPGVRSPGRPGR